MKPVLPLGPAGIPPNSSDAATSTPGCATPPVGPSFAGTGGEGVDPQTTKTAARPISSLVEAHEKDCIRRGNRPATLKDHEYGYRWLLQMGDTVDEIGSKSYVKIEKMWLEQGMSESQMNRCIANMKLTTKWGADFKRDWLEVDPLATLSKIVVARKEDTRRTFSLKDARAILEVSEDTSWWLPFLLYFSVGFRKMALMLRTGADWDSDTKFLKVRVEAGNKVNREQILPVGKKAAQALIDRDTADSDPLFPATGGGFHSEREPHRALQRACDKAGVQRGGCHAMRRCAATEIAHMQGCDIASLVLGHSDGNMTLAKARYIKAFAEDARKAVQAMEDALLAEEATK